MIRSRPGSRTLSSESVTSTATSISLSLTRSSPVISQSIQTRCPALSATSPDSTHRPHRPPRLSGHYRNALRRRQSEGRNRRPSAARVGGVHRAEEVPVPPPAAPARRPSRRSLRLPGSLRAGIAHPVALVRWLWLAYMTPGRPGRRHDRDRAALDLHRLARRLPAQDARLDAGTSPGTSAGCATTSRRRTCSTPPGTAIVIGLVVFHSYSGYGVDRRALRLMQWGIGMFLIAVPIDILNHRINGLDITSWSPSHALLYLGTAIMLAGAIRGWWLYAAPGPHPRPGLAGPVAVLRRERRSSRTSTRSTASCRCGPTTPGRRRPSRSCSTSPPRRGSRRRCSCCRCRPGCTPPG